MRRADLASPGYDATRSKEVPCRGQAHDIPHTLSRLYSEANCLPWRLPAQRVTGYQPWQTKPLFGGISGRLPISISASLADRVNTVAATTLELHNCLLDRGISDRFAY